MKLERIAKRKKPAYPSFNDHRIKRRGALKMLFGGLLATVAASCNPFRDSTRTGGIMASPENPKGMPSKPAEKLPLAQPVELEGDVAIARPPEKEIVTRGEMVAPRPPVPGSMPRPSKKPEPPPRTKGKLAPVKPPEEKPDKDTAPEA
jgi:hypothetical protein